MMEYKQASSWRETMDAWQTLRDMKARGSGFGRLSTETRVSADNIAWMAENAPILPFSREFCDAVSKVKQHETAPVKRRYVDVSHLKPRLERLYWYGYTYKEISDYAGVNRDIVRRIARGEYWHTHEERAVVLEHAVTVFERRMSRETKKLCEAAR